MKSLLTISAWIELGAGFAILCCPALFIKLLLGELILAPAALTVARIGGAGITALGVSCWFARGEAQSRAAKGLAAAMLLYNVAAVGVLAFAGFGLELHGVLLWPGVVLHAAMSVWCIACLAIGRH